MMPISKSPLLPASLTDVTSFNDLAWTELDDTKRGVIAGGLENGSLDLWNADKLLANSRCERFHDCNAMRYNG
jgi:hypothetical protein